jgi:hypothetical protein
MSPASGRFYAYDTFTRSMIYLDSKTPSLSFSDELGESFQESFWLPAEDQSYAFVLEGREVRLKQPITTPAEDLFRLGDNIVSYAALPSEGLFAFVDANFSISLVQLSTEGEPLQQWVGGPLLPSGQRITVGDMLPGGRLLLGLDTKELVLVDCLASLQAKTWIYETLPALSERILWVAPVRGQADRALIELSSTYLVYDVSTKSVVSTLGLEFSKSSLFASKRGSAHLGYKDLSKGTMTLVYPKGDGFAMLPLPASLGDPLSSYLTETYLLAQSSKEKAVRIRLSDALVEATLEVGKEARVGLSEDAVAAVYESPLGYIEIHRFDTKEPIVFKGFNRDRLRD